MIACLEEIAYRNNWIGVDDLKSSAAKMQGTLYGKYLERIVSEG